MMTEKSGLSSYRNCLLVIGSVMVFFIILETALALFWPHKITSRPSHEQYHPLFGWTNSPDTDGKVKVFGARNIYFHRRHNGLGLRSLKEIAYEKPPNVRRILLLGDSFFWGYGVDDQDVVSEVLQGMVARDTEVINGSVMGYATDQELLWLAEEGVKFKPDLVILGCFPANDWDDIAVSVMMGYPKPFFSLNGGKLSVRNVPVPDTRETRRKAFDAPDTVFGRLKQFLRQNTHTYPLLAGRLNSIPSLRSFLLRIGMAEEFTTKLPGIQLYTLKEENVPTLFNALVKEMKKVSNEAGADFLLVHIPEKEQDPRKPVGYSGVPDGAYGLNSGRSAYLSSFSSANRIKFLDLLPVVRKRHELGERLYVTEGYDHHWTPLGHKAAAEALFGWLGANGWTR